MQAHIFQHIPFEGPGSIEPWLEEKGFEISSTHFYRPFELPVPGNVDFLIIMGGPMSVNDEEKHPWLVKEKQFIRGFINEGKPVLGICLGSQLIASALGANVYPMPQKEIGWFPVSGIASNDLHIFKFPNLFNPLHWHGETFDLPAGAFRIAGSDGCQNQAFQVGRNVIAIQFHPEATPKTVQDFVFHFRNELLPGKYIQSEDEILMASPARFVELQEIMYGVLRYLSKVTVSKV